MIWVDLRMMAVTLGNTSQQFQKYGGECGYLISSPSTVEQLAGNTEVFSGARWPSMNPIRLASGPFCPWQDPVVKRLKYIPRPSLSRLKFRVWNNMDVVAVTKC